MEIREYTDADLVRQFQRGSSEAFEEIVMRFQDRVYRLSLIWLKDASHAEDVAQEVFVRAYRGLKKFRFRAEPYTWLYRATVNVCREHNRNFQVQTPAAEPFDSGSDPESQVKSEQSARQIRRLVSQLPERQQQVVVLRVFEQSSVVETAKLMGCREGTVKALLHKAMTKLKLHQDLLSDYL